LKYYAGIGSRQTPEPVLLLMEHIALKLEAKGYTCRTGGASGADMAFFYGASPNVDVFLPWEGFNGFKFKGIVCGEDATLRQLARRHHPLWDKLSPAAKRLHTRNVAQIIGCDIGDVRSEFVICWTPEGKGGGGTGQAIRVAAAYGVPVYDLALGMHRDKVKEIVR
jgi:hypothetical protein